MSKPGDQGVVRILKAAGYSWKGLAAAWRHEAAFRQEAILAILLIPAACWLGPNPLAKAAMIASVLLVLIIELVNAAIEAVVDRISTERHELSGRAKDMGSAAVLVALLNVLVVWGLILFA